MGPTDQATRDDEAPEAVPTLRGASFADLQTTFRHAGQPRLDMLVGTHQAWVAGPPWLRAATQQLLDRTGMPGWWGKQFDAAEPGTSVLVGRTLTGPPPGLSSSLPMTARAGPSRLDGRPALLLGYPPEAGRLWRAVADEVRVVEDGLLIGLSFVDALPLPWGLPFLLRRVPAR